MMVAISICRNQVTLVQKWGWPNTTCSESKLPGRLNFRNISGCSIIHDSISYSMYSIFQKLTDFQTY